MSTIVKSSHAQQNFGALIDQVLADGDVIVERYGTPRVVVVEHRRYQNFIETERELLRERLRQASASASARAAHLSEDEIDDLIETARAEVHAAAD